MATKTVVECDVCGRTQEARKTPRRSTSFGGSYPTGWRRTTTLTSGLDGSYAAVWTCTVKCAQEWLAQKG